MPETLVPIELIGYLHGDSDGGVSFNLFLTDADAEVAKLYDEEMYNEYVGSFEEIYSYVGSPSHLAAVENSSEIPDKLEELEERG